MFGPDTSSGSPAYGSDAQRNTRYTYLIARLRNRQMTMEEATELFSLMQGMLRTSESARLALARTPPPSSFTPPAPERPAAPVAPAPSGGGSDDFFLLGLLAMGAGAGLLAALARRMQEPGPARERPTKEAPPA